jgi:DNA repair exonuclease SbcCD ATPase subunit
VRIRRLQLKDVRRYRELDIDLAPGLTVVRGPNEAGKTTIQRAIELAVTRRVTSAAGDLESLRPWDAEPEARSVVTLEFEQDEEDGVKKGTLEKTFAGSRGTVRLEYEGQTIDDPALADQIVAELTGIPTEGFFRATASIRHQELEDVTRDEASLRDRLQASISGADRGTSRARKKLDKAIYDLTTKGDKNPGRLKVAETAIGKAQASVEQGEAALAQLAGDRDILAGAHDRRAEIELILAERRSMLEKARQAERLAAERDAAQERYERYRQAVEVTAQLDQLAATHPSPNPLPVVRAGVDRLRTLDVRARELRAALAGEVNVNFEIAPEPTTWRSVSRVSIVLIVIGLLVSIVSVAANVLKVATLGIIPAVVGGIIAGIGLILGGVAVGQRRSYSMGGQLRDVEIDRRLRGRSEMEAELAQCEADTARRLGTLGLEDLPAAETLLAAEEAHVAQIDRLTAQRDGLVGKEPPDSLTVVRDASALEISQKASAIDALGPIAKEPRARERLEVEVREQESGLERSRDDEANARARVEANTVDAEHVAGEAERLTTWREQLATLERRQRVYAGTLSAIDRAEQATMKTATRYLEQRMVRDLAQVTGGRYRHVRIDDRTLDIEVRAPEKRDWVKVSALSQGTMDLVYLTARLGLVRLVTGDRRPPLILDDPFVTLDDERATRALELLGSVATDFQVIYLTTSDRYDRIAAAVVELPGPTMVDDAPAPVAEPLLRDVTPAPSTAATDPPPTATPTPEPVTPEPSPAASATGPMAATDTAAAGEPKP